MVTKAEYEKAKAAVEKAYSKESIADYTKAYNEARSSGKSSSDAYSSASLLLKKNETTGGGSSNVNSTDVYGDVSGVRSSGVGPKDYSNYQETTLSPELNKYGANAREMEKAKAGSISQRNDILAGNLYKQGITDKESIRKYLNNQPGFQDTEGWEQDNTVDAIWTRMGGKDTEGETTGGATGGAEGVEGATPDLVGGKYGASQVESKDGMYWDAQSQSYVPIYGYNDLSKDQQAEIDRMSEADRKRISNEWAAGMQDEVRTTLDYRRRMDQEREKRGLNKEAHDIDQAMWEIQTTQSLRNAEESYNNLKQSWQYLGNMGMPGVSKTKIDAIGDAITEAKTQLQEFRKLKELEGDARANNWEQQVLQYSQQMANLQYDLDWKVSKEIQGALSKYTTAELEGKLDTIDGITAFRKELLDELDANISGITTGSLAQMQYINQQYQDIANRMYEYAENKNKVNGDMSAVKGYYVDGNGNPILNNQGQPIQVPQNAPMEPVFDKETGKLITFGLDENGQIVASVQQVYQGDATNMQSTIVSLLEQGVSVQDILKYVPNADLKTVQGLAEVVKPLGGGGYESYSWSGGNYNAVSESQKIGAYNSFVKQFLDANGKVKKGINGGQCGKFVNDYLQKMGMERLFTDPITEKKKYINSDTPKIGSVVIMDSPSQPQYGHVGIVKAINGDKISILQSNKAGEEQVFVSTKNKGDVLGYFDPTKSIDDFNKEISGAVYEAQGLNKDGYNNTRTGYYDKYLAAKFTTEDWKQIGDKAKFEEEVENYKKAKESEVADVTKDMLRVLYDLKDIGWLDYNNASLGIPRTDGYKKRRDLQNYLSNVTLNKLIESKKSGATFGALSDAELGILQDAASILDWGLDRGDFNNEVNRMIENLEQGLRDNGRSDIIAELKSTQNSNGTTKQKVGGGNLG